MPVGSEVKRFDEVPVRSTGECPFSFGFSFRARDNNHGDFMKGPVGAKMCQNSVAVNARQVQINHNQVRKPCAPSRRQFIEKLNALFPISGAHDLFRIWPCTQGSLKKIQIGLAILNDEDPAWALARQNVFLGPL